MGLFQRESNLLVEYSLTKSVNYQSVKAGLQFSVPKGIKLSEAQSLARFLVNFEISGKYDVEERKKLAFVYQECFGEPLIDYLEGGKK